MKQNPIEEMLDICHALIDMIENVGACPDVTAMQETFSDAFTSAMRAYQAEEIEVDIRTLPPIMFAFATEELPILCSGSQEDLDKAKQQLKLFIVAVNELVHPKVS